MKFPFRSTAKSENDTSRIAKQFSLLLRKGDIVVLNGELGSGKTFFIKSVISAFGIYSVNSPTFAIVNEYKNSHKFIHIDFYRINSLQELLDIGIEDYFNDSESIIFIEWGSLFNDILPKRKININITLLENNSREIEIEKIVE